MNKRAEMGLNRIKKTVITSFVLLAAMAVAHVIGKRSKLYSRSFLDEVDKLMVGRYVPLAHARHHVSLQRVNQHVCDGSIIGPNLVLTNSLCFSAEQVRAGSDVWSWGGSVHAVTGVLNFSLVLPRDDIILLKVSPSFIFDSTRAPINLSSNELPAGSTVLVTWFQRDQLHKLTGKFMSIMGKNECQFEISRADSDAFICGGNSAHLDNSVCPVLLGSPVFYNNNLFAVGMHHTNCYSMYTNELYSNIPYYVKTIASASVL